MSKIQVPVSMCKAVYVQYSPRVFHFSGFYLCFVASKHNVFILGAHMQERCGQRS